MVKGLVTYYLEMRQIQEKIFVHVYWILQIMLEYWLSILLKFKMMDWTLGDIILTVPLFFSFQTYCSISLEIRFLKNIILKTSVGFHPIFPVIDFVGFSEIFSQIFQSTWLWQLSSITRVTPVIFKLLDFVL